MSDIASQAGSVRAGYRRSRIEPIDPATIHSPAGGGGGSGSQPTRSPQQRPASTIASAKEEPKEGTCKKIMRVIFLLLNIFILAIAILMIIMGTTLWIVFRESGLSISEVAGGAPLSKWTLGVKDRQTD